MLLLLAACSTPSYEPWSTSYVHTVVPWVRDSTGHWLLVDTGTPRTQLRPSTVGGPPGERVVPGWSAGEVSGLDVIVSEALPDPVLEAEARGEIVGLGGILGADALFRQRFWMDPRSERLWFGDAPTGIEPVAALDVEPTGEGDTCLWDGPCFAFEDSRILVDVEVNDVPLTLLLDTAATYLMVDPLTLDRLGVRSHTYDFGFTALEIGAGEVRFDGLTTPSVAIATTDDAFTESLVRLELEVDRPVDGVIGHTFLRRFVVGVDAPEGRLTLSRYTSGPWDLAPDWVTPGFRTIESVDGCFVVSSVIADSEAERAGLAAGDCLAAVDGLTPDDIASDALMDHLGALGPGAPVTVTWDGTDLALPLVDWAR